MTDQASIAAAAPSETSNNSAPGNTRVGVVGLGKIGSGVVTSLDRSGVAVSGYDIDPTKASDLPCTTAASAADLAANSDVVLLVVVNGEQARDALFASDGIAAGAQPGLVVALLSTVSIDTLHQLAQDAAAVGLILIDTPATGGPKAAHNGLVVMAGGDDAAVDRAMPALRAFAKSVVRCGPLGAGMSAKLVRQVIVYGTWQVMYDAASLADAAGIDYQQIKEIIEQADPDNGTMLGLMSLRGEQAGALPDSTRSRIRPYYDLMIKDVNAAQDMAKANGRPLAMLDHLAGDAGRSMFDVPPDGHAR